VLRPIGRRALRVVPLDRLLVVHALVAEDAAVGGQPRTVANQSIPVVVADLVPKMTQHGSVTFAELLAQLLAEGIIGLGDVDRDHPSL
jgi:hypothetical protein